MNDYSSSIQADWDSTFPCIDTNDLIVNGVETHSMQSLDTISADTCEAYVVGAFVIRPGQGFLDGPTGLQNLGPKAMGVLALLARESGNVVSHDHLLSEVWKNRSVSSGALSRVICELRRRLGDTAKRPQYIHTVPGHGYLFQFIPGEYAESQTPAAEDLKIAPPLIQEPRHSPSQHANPAQSDGNTASNGSFLADLVRRRVLRAMGGYVLMSWIILQVAEIVFPLLGIPGWGMTLLLLLLATGFPLAAVVAWAVQITDDGIVLDVPSSNSDAFTSNKSGRVAKLLIISLLVALAALGYRLIDLETGTRSNPVQFSNSARCDEPV